jgi:hypothetical protein
MRRDSVIKDEDNKDDKRMPELCNYYSSSESEDEDEDDDAEAAYYYEISMFAAKEGGCSCSDSEVAYTLRKTSKTHGMACSTVSARNMRETNHTPIEEEGGFWAGTTD